MNTREDNVGSGLLLDRAAGHLASARATRAPQQDADDAPQPHGGLAKDPATAQPPGGAHAHVRRVHLLSALSLLFL
jgi:hypothetical protein